MSTASEIKKPTDLVKLVNVSGEGKYKDPDSEGKEKPHKHVVLSGMVAGREYVIDKETVVSRDVAEHLVKQTTTLAYGNRQRLKIVELPEAQRNVHQFPVLGAQVEELKKNQAQLEQENAELKAENKDLKAENDELKAKVKKLSK